MTCYLQLPWNEINFRKKPYNKKLHVLIDSDESDNDYEPETSDESFDSLYDSYDSNISDDDDSDVLDEGTQV